MTDNPGVRALIGYDIVDGVSVADYEHWLAEVHYPDLLSNPYLDRLVTNDVIRPIPSTLAGTPSTDEREPFYRVVELHFADRDAYDQYLEWFELNPIDPSRGPEGRTDTRFCVLTESAVADREHPYEPPL
jgi:hypothetical protein